MNDIAGITAQEEITTIARFIFDKGRKVHQRIDQIVRETMVSNNISFASLTIAQMEVIMAIHRSGEMTITELARKLYVSVPSTSTMVDRLEEKKILFRTRSKKDRRKVAISLVPDTENQINQVEQAVLRMFAELISKVGMEIGELWCKVLGALEVALDDQPDYRPSPVQSASE